MDSLPRFDSIQEAIDSGQPFRLSHAARHAPIKLEEIPEDKIALLHNALLCDDSFKWILNNEQDVTFIINLLKEHKKINGLTLSMGTITHIGDLASAIQTSHIITINIQRPQHVNINLTPILQALQYNNTLKSISIEFSVHPAEEQGLACAVSNENLENLQVIGSMQPSTWEILPPVLSNHNSLTKLELWSVNSAGCQAVGEILSKNSKIRVLFLTSTTKMNTIDIEKICSGLSQNLTLQSIHLTNLMEGATDPLFKLLAQNKCQLSKVRIIGSKCSQKSVETLSESLETNTMLKHLTLMYCNIDGVKCQILCQGLTHNKTLAELHLKYTELQTEGVKAICDMLINQTESGLKLLDISKCKIDYEQCKLITHMLTKNKTLTALILSYNIYSDIGTNAICTAMIENRTIKKLGIAGHQIDHDAVTGVKNMLMRNRTLRSLEMSSVSNEEDIPILCEGLKNNQTLTQLSLLSINNGLRDVLEKNILEALQDNYAIEKIVFGSSPTAVFDDLLCRNRQLKSSIKFLVAILSHNIARSSHALTILPREIWKQILSSITSPGMEPFDDVVETIFKSYEREA